MTDNQRLMELGGIMALGNVVGQMCQAGCPLEHQDIIHEAIDRAYIRLGDLKREPRSNAVRKERGLEPH